MINNRPQQSTPQSIQPTENNLLPNGSDIFKLPAGVEAQIMEYFTADEFIQLQKQYSERKSTSQQQTSEEKEEDKQLSPLPFFQRNNDSLPHFESYIENQLPGRILAEAEQLAAQRIAAIKKVYPEKHQFIYRKISFADIENKVKGINFIKLQIERLLSLYDAYSFLPKKYIKPTSGPTLEEVNEKLKIIQAKLGNSDESELASFAIQIQHLGLERLKHLELTYTADEFKEIMYRRTTFEKIKLAFLPSFTLHYYDAIWEQIDSNFLCFFEIYLQESSEKITDAEMQVLVNLYCENHKRNDVINLVKSFIARMKEHQDASQLNFKCRLVLCLFRNSTHSLTSECLSENDIQYGLFNFCPELRFLIIAAPKFFRSTTENNFQILLNDIIDKADIEAFRLIMKNYPRIFICEENLSKLAQAYHLDFIQEMVENGIDLGATRVPRPSEDALCNGIFNLFDYIAYLYFNSENSTPDWQAKAEKLFNTALAKISDDKKIQDYMIEKYLYPIIIYSSKHIEKISSNKSLLNLQVGGSSLVQAALELGKFDLAIQLIHLSAPLDGIKIRQIVRLINVPAFEIFIKYLVEHEENLAKKSPHLYKEEWFGHLLKQNNFKEMIQHYSAAALSALLTKFAIHPLTDALKKSPHDALTLLIQMQKYNIPINPQDVTAIFDYLLSNPNPYKLEEKLVFMNQLISMDIALPPFQWSQLLYYSKIEPHYLPVLLPLFNLVLKHKDGFNWLNGSLNLIEVMSQALGSEHTDFVLALMCHGIMYPGSVPYVSEPCKPLIKAMQDLSFHREKLATTLSSAPADEKANDVQTQLIDYLTKGSLTKEEAIIQLLQYRLLANDKKLTPAIVHSVLQKNYDELIKPFLTDKKPGFFDSLLKNRQPALLQKLILVENYLLPQQSKKLRYSP